MPLPCHQQQNFRFLVAPKRNAFLFLRETKKALFASSLQSIAATYNFTNFKHRSITEQVPALLLLVFWLVLFWVGILVYFGFSLFWYGMTHTRSL
jgi:hypothetical protein